jgi:hypothetical protein
LDYDAFDELDAFSPYEVLAEVRPAPVGLIAAA